MREACSLVWLALVGLFRSRASLEAEIPRPRTCPKPADPAAGALTAEEEAAALAAIEAHA
jgi:hypothetical protein